MLVATFLGTLVGAVMLSSTLANKKAYNFDLKRITLDQNLRSAMDIISGTLRVGGENLPTSFPAFEIVDGGASVPDEFIIRRNLLDEVLPVCSAIAAGSSAQQVYFSTAGAATSACTFSGQAHNQTTWSEYRLSKGGSVKAFIYDVSAKRGEFFDYVQEGVSGGTSRYILRGGGSWTNPYPVASSSVYLLEEWRMKLSGGLLNIEENGETLNPKNIVAGITGFQVSAVMSDGTVRTGFLRTDDWSQIAAIEISLSNATSYQKKAITRSLTARYFPRNILSK
jgi:hypothetical protein